MTSPAADPVSSQIDTEREEPQVFPQRIALKVNPRLLELLVCPLTKSLLEYDPTQQELISRPTQLAYPIRDGIPILLPDEARAIALEPN